MKKQFFLVSILLSGILVATIYSCKEDSKETCQQDEICEAKSVTACCDDNDVCVYKYDGKEYTEDEIDELADDLGCSSSSIVFKSAQYNDDLENVITKLKALMSKVREEIDADN